MLLKSVSNVEVLCQNQAISPNFITIFYESMEQSRALGSPIAGLAHFSIEAKKRSRYQIASSAIFKTARAASAPFLTKCFL